jgi:MFS family permease
MAWTYKPAWLIALGSTAVLLHAPFGPSSQSAIPNLAGPADLTWANGTLSAASSLGPLIGPAIGGVLYSGVGPGAAFGINALSFAISACLVAVIRRPFRSDGRQARGRDRAGVWDGARFMLSQPTLLTLTVTGAITFMATEIAAVADLPLIHQFGVGGTGYGIMNVAWGAGGLIGARLAARTVSEATETTAAVIGVIVFGAFVAAVGACLWFPVIPALMLLFAGADAFAFVGFGGIYQRRTPDALRGRMFAAVGAVTRLATAVSFAAAGFIVQAAGWRPVYLGGGLVDVACGILLAVAFRRGRPSDATVTP